ncbi:MAG: putative inactive lipase [Acidimicrobiales bacterium]|nr:putative inactive lipase [Acidimicrobiales bacterium]
MTSRSRSPHLLVLAAVVFLAGGCGLFGDFYDTPRTLVGRAPGDIIKTEPIELQAEVPAEGWRIMYVSTDADGNLIAATGVVARPLTPPPDGGYPVVTWAHGSKGVAPECAPSRNEPFAFEGLNSLLEAGYVVAGADYEGLGPGEVHPYLVGMSEAHTVLDMARAAQQMPEVDAGADTFVWGYSQGGHAALFAHQVAGDYAPDLAVKGVVAMAPVADLPAFVRQGLSDEDLFPYTALTLADWDLVYPEADVATITTGWLDDPSVVLDGCSPDLRGLTEGRSLDSLWTADPTQVQPWADLLAANNPQPGARGIPLLIIQGGEDTLIAAGTVQAYVDAACAAGEAVDYEYVESWNHLSPILLAVPQAALWTARLEAGLPPANTCV